MNGSKDAVLRKFYAILNEAGRGFITIFFFLTKKKTKRCYLLKLCSVSYVPLHLSFCVKKNFSCFLLTVKDHKATD